jgi:thiamine biosynthesis lipoprotein
MVMGLEKAKVFLKKHNELQAYMIYSDDNGNYQVYETPGIKGIVSEVEE